MLAVGEALMPKHSHAEQPRVAERRFRLDYAPHFGMFKHSAHGDLTDQLRFAADQGFTAWEDQGLPHRPAASQRSIARALTGLDLRTGAIAPAATFREVTFGRKNESAGEQVLAELQRSVELAQRVRSKWLAVVPGQCVAGLAWKHQAAGCIELLKRCCEVLEPHGLVIVLRPISGWAGRPGRLVQTVAQASYVCRAVASPSCRILFDIYHQEITQGNTLESLDRFWPEIGYLQFGDNPGRKEPGTGCIDCRRVFQTIHARGYDGVVGMEHGNSRPGREGELAVIDAYAKSDPGYLRHDFCPRVDETVLQQRP
jgi:hydroxypyruvate isomerase